MPRIKPAAAGLPWSEAQDRPLCSLVAVSAENFKSFRRVSLTPSGLDVLIGPNASGKSNLAQLFRFLRDVAQHGAVNAISLQGGEDFLRNIRLPQEDQVIIEAQLEYAPPREVQPLNGEVYLDVEELRYRLVIPVGRAQGKRPALERHLTLKGPCYAVDSREVVADPLLGSGEIHYVSRHREGRNGWELVSSQLPAELDPDSIMGPGDIESDVRLALQGIGFYDVSPRLSKSARPFTGKADLDEDGANLALVLKGLLEDPDSRRRFLNLLSDVLPYVADVSVDRLADRSVLFSLRETFSATHYLPASFLSMGQSRSARSSSRSTLRPGPRS